MAEDLEITFSPHVDAQMKEKTKLIFKQYEKGLTPDTVAIQSLIEGGGIDIHARDDVGNTLLDLSARGGHRAICELLIEKGADFRAGCEYGVTVLHKAAKNGHRTICELLIEKGADLHARNRWGITALHKAAENGHTYTCELLIEQGAHVDARDNNGNTPLHAAACDFDGYKKTCVLLIEKGADVNALNYAAATPLHMAAVYGKPVIYELLIEKGADPLLVDKDGEVPADIARRRHNTEATDILEKAAEKKRGDTPNPKGSGESTKTAKNLNKSQDKGTQI